MSKKCKEAAFKNIINAQQGIDTFIIITGIFFTWVFTKHSNNSDLLSALAFFLVLLWLLSYALYTTKLYFIKEMNKLGYYIPDPENKTNAKKEI